MLNIRGKWDIYISRGDTKRIGVNLVERINSTTDDYVIADDEYIVFKLWDVDFRGVIKELRSEVGTTVVDLPAEFTRSLRGREFCYSVDLILRDGTKETVIGQNANTVPRFVILEA